MWNSLRDKRDNRESRINQQVKVKDKKERRRIISSREETADTSIT